VLERQSVDITDFDLGLDDDGYNDSRSWRTGSGKRKSKSPKTSEDRPPSVTVDYHCDVMNSDINGTYNEVDRGNSNKENEQNLGKSLYETDTENLQTMISSDSSFYHHLNALKAENKKTLKALDRLYQLKVQDERDIAQAQRNTAVNLSNALGRSKEVSPRAAWDSEKLYSSVIGSIDLNHDMVKDSNDESGNLLSDDEEEELNEPLKVHIPASHVNILPEKDGTKFRGRIDAYDRVSEMWENFSVEDYAPYEKPEKTTKVKEAWSPQITVPEPFEMTRREARMKNRKSKKIEEIKQEKLRKELEEEAELQKRARPTPVPPTTYLPLYEDQRNRQEMRRQYTRELSKELTQSMQKPFKFMKREQAKKEMGQSAPMDRIMKTNEKNNKKQYKANP
jgi:hypothetical protein